jgi:hypothetical protein
MTAQERNVKKLSAQKMDIEPASSAPALKFALSYLRFALRLAWETTWLGRINVDFDFAARRVPPKGGSPK